MRVRFIVLAITTIFACSLLTEFGPVRAEGGTAMYGLARKVKDCRSECEKGNQCLDFCPHKCAGACAVRAERALRECLTHCGRHHRS